MPESDKSEAKARYPGEVASLDLEQALSSALESAQADSLCCGRSCRRELARLSVKPGSKVSDARVIAKSKER